MSSRVRCAIGHLCPTKSYCGCNSDYTPQSFRRPTGSPGRGRPRLRMQRELLHPPVEDFPHVQLVLGRTGHLVDPAELLRLLPRPAEHPDDRTLERYFVDAAGISVGYVQELVRPGSDADRPRRA